MRHVRCTSPNRKRFSSSPAPISTDRSFGTLNGAIFDDRSKAICGALPGRQTSSLCPVVVNVLYTLLRSIMLGIRLLAPFILSICWFPASMGVACGSKLACSGTIFRSPLSCVSTKHYKSTEYLPLTTSRCSCLSASIACPIIYRYCRFRLACHWIRPETSSLLGVFPSLAADTPRREFCAQSTMNLIAIRDSKSNVPLSPDCLPSP